MLLYDWPRGVAVSRFTPKSGPMIYGTGQSMVDYVQVTAAPTGLVAFELGIAPSKGAAARELRALIAGLASGANAVSWTFVDPDRMSWTELGLTVSAAQETAGMPWSNGLPWSNGQNWRIGPPLARLSVAAAKGATVLTIDATAWGGNVGVGTILGIVGQFGFYTVSSSRRSGATATVTVWPGLRRAAEANAAVTLQPAIAARLTGADAAQWSREAWVSGGTLTLVELPDGDLRRSAARI